MSESPRSIRLIYLDGDLVEEGDARLRAVTGSSLHGRGVFTTIAIRNGELFGWHRHTERLARDSGAIGLNTDPVDWGHLRSSLSDLLARNGHVDGKARITFLDSSPPAIWNPDSEPKISIIMQTAPMRPQQGVVSLTISPLSLNSRSPLAGIKSCNYLEPLLAAEEARRRGFDEAIRLNEKGEVVGCCLANLFWISKADGALRTPSQETGCLPGTTRAAILESVEVSMVRVSFEEFLEDAESVFLTSAVRGIAPAGMIEGLAALGDVPAEIRSLLPI